MTKENMRFIAANWKMNPATLEEARKLLANLEHLLLRYGGNKVEVVICAPSIYLTALKHSLHKTKLGAQNLSAEEKGPHTGEVSALMLKNLGVRHIIVGHSERRALGESDEFINKKMAQCREHNLHPILCVGYGTTKNTTLSSEKKIITAQLREALKGVGFKKGEFTIAYEPAWTISKGPGTAKPIAPERAAEVIEFIKKSQSQARVIYGASITAKNAPDLAQFKVIEGGLVGGASLIPEEFVNIIKSFQT